MSLKVYPGSLNPVTPYEAESSKFEIKFEGLRDNSIQGKFDSSVEKLSGCVSASKPQAQIFKKNQFKNIEYNFLPTPPPTVPPLGHMNTTRFATIHPILSQAFLNYENF